MKKYLLLLLFLTACAPDKYLVKYPDFNMPQEPKYEKATNEQTIAQSERTVGKNLTQCVGYSKQMKGILEEFKKEADSTNQNNK